MIRGSAARRPRLLAGVAATLLAAMVSGCGSGGGRGEVPDRLPGAGVLRRAAPVQMLASRPESPEERLNLKDAEELWAQAASSMTIGLSGADQVAAAFG